MIKGKIIYPFFKNKGRNFGSWSFGSPFNPNFFASRWTVIKIPVKYKTAGMIAAFTIVIYGSPKLSAIRNAAAPIIGGINWPPVDAAASTAPANSPLYPSFFIIGIVNEPEPTVFETEEPETVPNKAEERTATFAGPPDAPPAIELHKSIKNWPIPVFSSKAPKRMNKKIKVEHAPIGVPIIPSVL